MRHNKAGRGWGGKPDPTADDPGSGPAGSGHPAADPDPFTVYGFVERIEDDLATVLIGEDFEEWTFPIHVLPEDVKEESFVLIEGAGRDLRVIGVAHSLPSLDSRLDRRLNRKRAIVVPLPHREHHSPEVKDLAIDQRVSRYARNLGSQH
jgi:hypothetical protein